MHPEKASALYLEHRRHRHVSEYGLQHDVLALKHFTEYCRLHHLEDLREATLETLLDYHRWFRQRKRPDGEPLSCSYINAHARQAKALFRFLAERNYILTDIGRNFPALKSQKSLPRGILTKEQMMQLLQQPLLTTPLGFRDRTMLEVLYSTGLRGLELCRLTLYDFDPQERMIRVLAGKGKKDRVVPIGKVAAGHLSEYIRTLRPILAASKQNAWIFLSANGRALVTKDLHRILATYRAKAHLPDNITTHSLRHTCATEMLKGGASIRHVQELLGHASIQSTQIYTHVVPSELKKAHARTSPSERRKGSEPVAFLPGVGPVHWNDNRNSKYWSKIRPGEGRAKIKKLRETPLEK